VNRIGDKSELDDDEIPWVTKKFAGDCSG
jgi:hypothetical protein